MEVNSTKSTPGIKFQTKTYLSEERYKSIE